MRTRATSTRPLVLAGMLAGMAVAGVACAPADEDVAATTAAARVCVGPATVEGVDVSTYEGTVDWPTVAASGKVFAIARIGDGLGEDPTFDRNYAGIRSVGMIRGSYQFFRAGRDPNAMADIVIRHVPPPLLPGDLPPVLDVELDDGYSAATIIAHIHTWADRIHAAYGRDPIIYTGTPFWNASVAGTADFASYPLWVAAYPSSCTDTGTYCPNLPDAWSGWTMWQYCGDTRTTPGISALADFDVFQGTRAQLMALTGPGGSVTPPPLVYAATYVAQSFPDSSVGMHTLHVGETLVEYMDLRNTGTAPWDANTRLATTVPRDRASALVGPDWVSSSRLSAVVGTVMPGATYRFSFTVQGNSVGTFDEHFGMVQEGVAWFSDPGEGGPRDDLYEGVWQVLPALDGGIGTPPVDAAVPVDLGTDAGSAPDFGVPLEDAGVPADDLGAPADDAAVPRDDAGGPDRDAGAATADSGAATADSGAATADSGAVTGDAGGGSDSDAGGTGRPRPLRGGCCHVAGGADGTPSIALAALATAALASRRRRRRI